MRCSIGGLMWLVAVVAMVCWVDLHWGHLNTLTFLVSFTLGYTARRL